VQFSLGHNRVSDPHFFHADPDTGSEIFSDPEPDPRFEIFSDPDPDAGHDFFEKLVVFKRKKFKSYFGSRSKCGS